MPLIASRAGGSASSFGGLRTFAAAYSSPIDSYNSLATITVGSTALSSVTFAGIPAGYKHLQIRALFVMSGTVSSGFIAFNGDNASGNYSYHGINGDSTGVGATALISQNQGKYTGLAGTSPAGNNIMVMDILDYANTNKHKTARAFYCWDANGTGYVEFNSNRWGSTLAISSIALTTSGNSFAQYSHIALYGVK